MAFVYANPNPSKQLVGDCVVRAISLASGRNWEDVYLSLMVQGFAMHDMPSSNAVWGSYLVEHGYIRKPLPSQCPQCYTVKDFCKEFNDGVYIAATGSHVIACAFGSYLDTWDSGDETVICYFERSN